ncbi:MAG: hypothetical protein ACOC6K_04395, partial [Thermodesulfobacteriota bacterium]
MAAFYFIQLIGSFFVGFKFSPNPVADLSFCPPCPMSSMDKMQKRRRGRWHCSNVIGTGPVGRASVPAIHARQPGAQCAPYVSFEL